MLKGNIIFFYVIVDTSVSEPKLDTNYIYERKLFKAESIKSKADRPSRSETPCLRDSDCSKENGTTLLVKSINPI